MRELLWISPAEGVAVVIATTGMYLTLVLIVRVLGQRVLSGMSGFDFAAVVAFGSVLGRAALGDSPRLAAGLVALLTLVVLQACAGQVRARKWGARAVTTSPVLLMAGSRVCTDQLRRCHVQPVELQAKLRLAGVRHPDEVAAVVFETSGAVSVLKRDREIDPMLLSGVVGASLVPPDLLAHPDHD
ncbi:MAG: DUF421 domain-containing protein [Nocardioides sp.]|nr:DUF421 domain-containing protein [Nocardioides sp.]